MNRLGLFAAQAIKRLPKAGTTPSRALYTDHLYPYPFKYFNEKVYPSVVLYRETWEQPGWNAMECERGIWAFRFFWAWFFWSFFHDPGALFGHCDLPDPTKWTDEELGIPPLEVGSYRAWMEKDDPEA